MKNFTDRNRLSVAVRPAVALLTILAFWASPPLCQFATAQQKMTGGSAFGEQQRIRHVLNRLGFGPRSGDVESVKRMGLENYIEQQLHPERISDEVAEAKLKNLPTLSLTTAELYAKYPNPGKLIRQLQRSGELPADLAALRENPSGAAPAPSPSVAGEMSATPGAAIEKESGKASEDNRRDYRQAMREYYVAHNLLPPQRITTELQASRILRAVYSQRQLQEVMVDFWTNHFNVYANKGADRWLLVSYDRDTIRPHSMGNFADLLRATAQSPAMLFYLDNFQSVSPKAQGRTGDAGRLMPGRRARRQAVRAQEMMPAESAQAPAKRPKRGINENYARELMELHTLGVGGGYTQKDVQEVARCFTGWTISNPRGVAAGTGGDAGQFTFNLRLHDDGEKIVLGHKIPAGGGIKDGHMVLDILARHPATAKFIATKLGRRFVTDNPPPALVERVAAAYTKSDGDIRATLRAIFSSPEFNAPATYRAKIKTPFELSVSAMRALGAETNGNPAIHEWIAKMGEPLYMHQAPTGYPDTADSWVNTGALLERLNFALALTANRIKGTQVDLTRFANESVGLNGETDKSKLVNAFIDRILQGEASPQTRDTLIKQLNNAPAESNQNSGVVGDEMQVRSAQSKNERAVRNVSFVNSSEAAKIAGLVLGTPEFQRQ